MARFSVCFLLIFNFSATYSYAGAAALSLEEKLQELEIKLEANVNNLKTTKVQLEEKVTQLETQLELNNELRNDLTLKVTQLETKNVQLEVKVQEQENILSLLLKAAELPTSATGSHTILNNRKTAIGSTGRSAIPRTCREFRAINPSLPSGMQWIDPDGQGVGDSPIYVYCNMTSGSTSIVHDSELPIDVGHCADPGCYSRSINYNASIGQIKTLMELSTECHQSITYGCNFAPFELNGVAYSWWNDRDGNAQYFWAGNNTGGVHTCQCGIDGNCVDSVVKCNCDTLAPMPLIDHGVITDENLLPVSRLNFGRTQLGTSSGIHTLGRFECTGTVALTQMPTSCEDLWLIGHTLNGFYLVMEGKLVKNVYCDFTKFPSDTGFQSLIGYAEVKPKPTYFGMPTSCDNLKGTGHTSSGLYSVMGTTKVESVYCDFTKVSNASGFQKWIGYADVKSIPTYFYVQRSANNFNQTNISIPFDVEQLNVGGAMNLKTGKFTAPRTGTYFFSFIGLFGFIGSTSRQLSDTFLYKNGAIIARSRCDENATVLTSSAEYENLSLQSILNLNAGDQIWLQIASLLSGAFLHGDNNTNFNGFMLDEEISQSVQTSWRDYIDNNKLIKLINLQRPKNKFESPCQLLSLSPS